MLRDCALRLCVGWLVCSALGYVLCAPLLAACAPLVTYAVRALAPELRSTVVYVDDGAGPQLLLDARSVRPIVLDSELVIPAGQELPARANGVHVLVPLILLVSALGALPVRSARERSALLLAALPGGLVLLLATAPFQLLGLIELALQEFALDHGVARGTPWHLQWMLFLEGGGRWVLPLALAALLYALLEAVRTPRAA